MAVNRKVILDVMIDRNLMDESPLKELIYNLSNEQGIDLEDYDNVHYAYEPYKSTETEAHIVVDGIPSEKKKSMSYQSTLNDLKELRNRLESIGDFDEKKRHYQEVLNMVESLEGKVGLANEMSAEFRGELDEVDRRLSLMKEAYDTKNKEYEKNCSIMKNIFDKESEIFNSDELFNADQLDNIRREFAAEKLVVSSEISRVKQEMVATKKMMTNLKRKRNMVERDILRAEALGLTVEDYQAIKNSLRKRKLMNSIYESKDLEDIVAKKATDRTKEEKALLKDTKEEIIKAIADEMKKDNKSVLDTIELLYHVDTNFYRKQEARKFSLSEEELNNVVQNISNSPIQIKGVKNTNYTPGKKPDDLENHEVIIYNDSENGILYLKEDDMNWLGINTDSAAKKEINNNTCYQISNPTAFNILKNKDNKEKPYKVRSVGFQAEKQAKKHSKPAVEAIIYKITKDLNIGAHDTKRYVATNLKPTKQFLDELKTGNYLYNIVHVGVGVVKASVSFLRKMSAKLLLSKQGKNAVIEMQNRIEELSPEEIEVLFNEYKGSVLKTDMNNQINSLILDKLKRYGLEQVEDLNGKIKIAYSSLFTLLGEVKVLEEKLYSDELSPEERIDYMLEKNKCFATAADHIKVILNSRRDANNLLSSGIHGIEEDFKSVSTKMNYVGLRFAKSNSFDNDLQAKLAEYDQGINDAIEDNDNESLVENFMALESEYYNNTKIEESLVGKKSVGTKYYTPLAEQFDYRDDPFIRDLLTTLALTSATVSAVNAIRVHDIEEQALNNINQSGEDISTKIHESVDALEKNNSNYMEGLEAQIHQSVENTANTLERSNLDAHEWHLTDSYQVADQEAHEFYNSFHDSVTNQLNDISTRYSSGAIEQMEALDEMVNVANNAQATLTDVCQSALEAVKPYAESHNIDLVGIEESLQYVVDNPLAVVNMNNSMLDVGKVANSLDDLANSHLEGLQQLPSDIESTVICAASAAALATKVSLTMDNKYHKKGSYGDEVTDQMEEYLFALNSDVEEQEKGHNK